MRPLSISRFWRYRKTHYRLAGKKCLRCGRAFYPPKRTCPYCGSTDLDNYEPPSRGEIITWTKLYETGSHHTQYRPLYLALVKLGEMTVLLQITDVTDENKQLYKGAPVELVFRKLKEDGNYGLIYYGLKARPLPTQQE